VAWLSRQRDALRDALGADRYAAAIERGRRLPGPDAVDHALAVIG
jgi:hypothetical protein